jgi:uncharacterized SAM-binding protein YcdF (DUF218 family)
MRVVAGLVGVVVAVAAVAAWGAGRFLVVADPLPAGVDAIVVLAGSIADRALEAADLYRSGIAPRVVITREATRHGTGALAARGVRLPESDDVLLGALRRLGVPDDAIVRLRRRNVSTESEARTIARWACSHRVRGIVVVTSRPHTRRARLILRQALGPRVAVWLRGSRYDGFMAARWWRNRDSMKEVLREYEKLAHYWLREHWLIRPCGGLRRRQDLAAARSSGASSPLACISRTMSQPPMNFPPTKTCGMVGQFV